MEHNALVRPARPPPNSLPPRKQAVPRRLRITLWQTHYWNKRIIKREPARTQESKLKPCAGRSNSAHACVSFARQRRHAQRWRSHHPHVLHRIIRLKKISRSPSRLPRRD